MTGILERIEEKLDRVLKTLAQSGNAGANMGTGPSVLGDANVGSSGLNTTGQSVQTGASPSSLLGGGAVQYPPATNEMITALITPHVGNPNTKAALQQQMAHMGITALPDARPDQYGELYYRFQQVINGIGAQQQQGAAPSII